MQATLAQRGKGTAFQLQPSIAVPMFVLVAAVHFAFATAMLGDGDTSWHIATGRLILAEGAVPTADPFSFTAPGRGWHAHEWLAEIPMAVLYDAGGWPALVMLFVLAATASLAMIGAELSRRLPLRWTLALLAALVGLLAPSYVARPHVLAWPLLVGWLLILLRARERSGTPPLAAALIMVVWANLHASYIVGLVLVGVFALESLLEDRSRGARLPAWTAFGMAALAAALVTPHGLQGLFYPFQVSGMEALRVIEEWRPTRLPRDAVFLLFMAGTAVIAARSWRKVGVARLILLVALSWMALEHARHQALFAIITLLTILPRAADVAAGRSEPSCESATSLRDWRLLAVGLFLLAALRFAVPLVPTAGAAHMDRAYEAVPAALRQQPVLNSYSFGGPLILRGVRPFIDGRADMYGDELTLLHDRITSGDMPAFRETVGRYGIRWVILSRGEKLASKLDREPGWRRLYRDDVATVHVRVECAEPK